MIYLKKNTMTIMLLFVMIAFEFVLSGCSETSSPDNQATVNVQSKMNLDPMQLVYLNNKNEQIQKSEVDSVRILKVRILLSRIKFHLEKDTNDAIDQAFKTGPFLFVGDSTGTYFDLANGQMPAGLYEKIKFEIHRFSSNDLSQYANHTVFKDFASNDRYSVIIDGIAYKNNIAYSFTYYGSPTANLSLKFEPSLELNENTTTDIVFQIDPMDLFQNGNYVYDPRDADNMNDIDNLIKAAIKAVKKN